MSYARYSKTSDIYMYVDVNSEDYVLFANREFKPIVTSNPAEIILELQRLIDKGLKVQKDVFKRLRSDIKAGVR